MKQFLTFGILVVASVLSFSAQADDLCGPTRHMTKLPSDFMAVKDQSVSALKLACQANGAGDPACDQTLNQLAAGLTCGTDANTVQNLRDKVDKLFFQNWNAYRDNKDLSVAGQKHALDQYNAAMLLDQAEIGLNNASFLAYVDNACVYYKCEAN